MRPLASIVRFSAIILVVAFVPPVRLPKFLRVANRTQSPRIEPSLDEHQMPLLLYR